MRKRLLRRRSLTDGRAARLEIHLAMHESNGSAREETCLTRMSSDGREP